MSHFTVLVVGPDVEKQLQPFHEFECTGVVDEYVLDVDETAKLRAEYESGTERRLRAPDGTLHEPWDPQFFRDPTVEEFEKLGPRGGALASGTSPLTLMAGSGVYGDLHYDSREWGDGLGYRTKIKFVPEGYEEITLPRHELQTFAEWVAEDYGRPTIPAGSEPDRLEKHKYGWMEVDEQGEVVRVIDRTNVDKRWDWWLIGGRWTGFFRLKQHGDTIVRRVVGEPGLMTPPVTDPWLSDQALKRDIDFDAMRMERGFLAASYWDKIHGIVAGRPVMTWAQMMEKHKDASHAGFDHKAAREEYWAQQPIMDLRQRGSETRDSDLMFIDDDSVFTHTRDEWIARARASAGRTHAVLMNGTWYERGEMGWWATIFEDKGTDAWTAEFAKLIDSLPDDALLTLVDCHI